jgi:hypothetical protein
VEACAREKGGDVRGARASGAHLGLGLRLGARVLEAVRTRAGRAGRETARQQKWRAVFGLAVGGGPLGGCGHSHAGARPRRARPQRFKLT